VLVSRRYQFYSGFTSVPTLKLAQLVLFLPVA
jgi:hypothetical protein